MLRTVLLWLMMLGVFAGLSVRAVPLLNFQGHSHAHEEGHGASGHIAHEHHHGGHDHAPADDGAPGNTQESPDAPLSKDFHFHEVWSASSAIATASVWRWQTVIATGPLLAVDQLRVTVPEGPYLDGDIPPLI